MAFLLLLAQTPPQLCGVPEDGSLPPQYKSLNPWSIGSRADLIDKILCLFVLSCLGAAWDTEARSLICLTWTSLRVENWPALLSDTVRWWTTHSHLGLKILAEMQQTAQRLGRKARENFFFFFLRNQSLEKHPRIFGNLETQIFVQGRSDAQKRP